MQRTESESEIQIAVIDPTYLDDDGDNVEERSEAFRRALEDEYGVDFIDGDIGPSASIAAFITFVAANWEFIGPAALAVFFGGKRVEDSWNWWASKAQMILSFSKKQSISVNRNGAAILAVEAIKNEIGKEPDALKLLSYGIGHMGEADDLESFRIDQVVDGPTDTLFLGFTKHVLEIEADGQRFRVGVEGSDVEVIRLD